MDYLSWKEPDTVVTYTLGGIESYNSTEAWHHVQTVVWQEDSWQKVSSFGMWKCWLPTYFFFFSAFLMHAIWD